MPFTFTPRRPSLIPAAPRGRRLPRAAPGSSGPALASGGLAFILALALALALASALALPRIDKKVRVGFSIYGLPELWVNDIRLRLQEHLAAR